jgi:hypothetical protein
MLAQSLGQLLLSQPQELMHNNNHQRPPPNDLLAVMVIWRRTLANYRPELGRFRTPNQVVAGIPLRLTTMKMMMPSWEPLPRQPLAKKQCINATAKVQY